MLMQKIKREAATLRDIVYHRLYFKPGSERDVIDQFHKLYYDSYRLKKTWGNTFWMGTPVGKSPFDLWMYQELFFQLKPDLLIETGTNLGGSAFYYASLFDLLGKGRVVTIDVDPLETTLAKVHHVKPRARPPHDRITYLSGSSTSDEIFAQVTEMARGASTILVSLDSDHREEHVLQEMKMYGSFVTPGSYMIVEDSNINGHPVYPTFGPGPMEAIEQFMEDNKEFEFDKRNENHLMTFNPNGMLRRR
jgi:cephalosporin hydroxylase